MGSDVVWEIETLHTDIESFSGRKDLFFITDAVFWTELTNWLAEIPSVEDTAKETV